MIDNEERRAESRLDLRALDATEDPDREDAVIRAVLTRIAKRALLTEWPTWMTRAQRVLAVAAAVLLLMAGAALFTGREATVPDDAVELIQRWAASSHVPTNGELLAAYRGYRQ